MITTARYYRLAIWLPIIVALLSGAMISVLRFLPTNLYAVIFMVIGWPALAGFIGGAPYVIFALCAAVWMRGRSEAEIRRCALWAPLRFLPIFWLIAPFMYNGGTAFGLRDAIEFDASMTLFVLLFGYAYVAAYFQLLIVLRRRGYVADALVASA